MEPISVQFGVDPDIELRTIEGAPDQSLLEVLIQNKVEINHVCEGMASCGTCRVLVVSGGENLKSPEGLELEMSEDRSFSSEERLSCQIQAVPGLGVRIP